MFPEVVLTATRVCSLVFSVMEPVAVTSMRSPITLAVDPAEMVLPSRTTVWADSVADCSCRVCLLRQVRLFAGTLSVRPPR